MEKDNTTSTQAPSEGLVKLMIGYDNLPEDEKKAFEAEITKPKSRDLSETIRSLLSNTGTRIANALKRSKLTKVSLEKKGVPEQILDGELDPTVPLYLTIASGEEMEDEIRLQIEELTEKIAKEFSVDKFAFIEIFHDHYELLHYYIFTNEPDNFSNFFPEGYELNGYDSAENAYNSYILRNYTQKEIKDTTKRLTHIFADQFPHRSNSRISKFIAKSNFIESLLGFKSAISEHNKKFN